MISQQAALPIEHEQHPSKRPAAQPPYPGTLSRIDPSDQQWYLNRELTWLAFKRRVLHEAADERVPLLERLKFLALVSGNVDEFFMKRIGGLKQQIGAGLRELTPDGRTPRQQVEECHALVRQLEADKDEILRRVLKLLRQKGIILARYQDLSAKQRQAACDYYRANIFPLLTPQSIDPAHPFPFISNLSLNLLVSLGYPKSKQTVLARVKVPLGLGTPRFIRVGDVDHFVSLEEVMMHNLDGLFPGMQVRGCGLFRVTRNANTEKNEEEADDLMEMIESELKERRFAPIVRLEVEQGMSPVHRGILASELELNEESDVFEVPTLLAMRDLLELARLDHPRLHDPPHYPLDHHLLKTRRNIFHIVRDAGSILLQHPYESFATSVERLLREAAADSKVLGIKMTLYRTAPNSAIVDSLLQAAHNGKQVAVVVELKARFDEQANIRLAEMMEEAGIHVTFGVVGLKTYCKAILIVRQDYSGLRRYVHLGTGNYHTEKARIYSDLGLMTCDDAIGRDVTELFNYLTTGFSVKRNFSKLIVAPRSLKKAVLLMIEREVALHALNGGGQLRFKVNALEDCDIVEALYWASMAGVRIELIVRDTCRLRPGVPGLSENIRVISLVGRFMEHSRIYYFRNNGADDYFIGSADLMKRNLETRVELLIPVESPELKGELQGILDLHQADRRSAWEMQPDGGYRQRVPSDEKESEGSQQQLIVRAEQRARATVKGKKRGF